VVVHAGWDKQDSLMRGVVCDKLHGGPSQLSFAHYQSSIDSQMFVENRDFCLPHLHSMRPLGGLCRNIAMTFGMEKLEWSGYPMVKKTEDMSIRFDRIHERDGRRDRHRTTA